jgi:hypothetical protein
MGIASIASWQRVVLQAEFPGLARSALLFLTAFILYVSTLKTTESTLSPTRE